MTLPLFRPQAIEHQRDKLFGEALIVWPVAFKILALGSTMIVAAFAVFVTLGEYTRKAHVLGYLVPTKGFVKVYARESATVLERRVKEGDLVKKGDVLFFLSLDRVGLSGLGAGQVAVSEIKRRHFSLLQEKIKLAAIGKSQTDQLQKRANALSTEYAKIDREIVLQRQRVEIFRKTSERYKQLVAEGFFSLNQYQVQNGLLLEQEVQLSSLERNKLSIAREIETTKQQIPETALRSQNDLSILERQISSLSQDLAEVDARREIIVVAPADGTVTGIQSEPGQLANSNVPMLNIIPLDAVFEARLLAPASAVGFIKPGKAVKLRYAAYPYQRFGHQEGVVTQVSRMIVTPSELSSPVQSQEPFYVVAVSVANQQVVAYGEKYPLQAGMTLEADVLLDSRPIYQWILEPLYSIRGRI